MVHFKHMQFLICQQYSLKLEKKRIMSPELHSMANLSLNNCNSEKKKYKRRKEKVVYQEIQNYE